MRTHGWATVTLLHASLFAVCGVFAKQVSRCLLVVHLRIVHDPQTALSRHFKRSLTVVIVLELASSLFRAHHRDHLAELVWAQLGLFFFRRDEEKSVKSNHKRTCPDSLNQSVSNVMNHLMTTGHRTICSSGDTHIQQGRGESSGCRTCQKRTSSKPPRLLDTFLQDLRDFSTFGLSQEAHERSSLFGPAPARFASQDHQATSSIGTNQLGICCLLLVSSNCKVGPVNVRCASVRGTVAMQW